MDFKTKANLFLLAGSHSVNSVYNRLLTPILPLIVSDFGLNYAQAGLIISTYALASSLFQLPISFLADFTGKRRLILTLSLLINAVPVFFYGASSSFPILLTFVFLSGLGSSAYHPSAVTMIASEAPQRRGFVMGIFKAGGDFGSILTPLAVGSLAAYLATWRGAVQYFVLPGLIWALLIWLRFRDTALMGESIRQEAKTTLRELLGNRIFVLLVFLSAFRVMGLRGIMAFLPFLLAESLGYGTVGIGWVLTVYFLIGTVSALAWGRYSTGKKETLFIVAMMAASMVSLSFIPWMESRWLLLGAIALLAGNLNPSQGLILAVTTEVVDERRRTSSIGLLYTLNEATAVSSPLLGGLIAQAFGLRKSFLFYALLCFLATALACAIHLEKKKPTWKVR